ncbi:MAG: sodium-translocating pyrophosphatase [Thermoprotei archaeon]|nr:MAG: sodium-translocating pyrophosphatase [Thermoprotei archaeon]RLF18931.1 MAG: sodium-translocating pyrophosphatase [Thermoprotei archaeon]
MYPLIALVASIIALLSAAGAAFMVLAKPKGTERMVEIYEAIKQGAKAYMGRQYKTLLTFMIILSVIFALAVDYGYFVSGREGYEIYFPHTGLSFLVGAIFSALAGYVGMRVAVEGNVRTANSAKSGLKEALGTSFKGGLVMGLCMVGLALLGVTVFYLAWRNPFLFAGFGFGGSLVALFARIGGGIYTKSADVGADLVGKVEAGIPEDDPRNPAVIADAVGDNVGDVAGMAADIFETYAVTLIGAMLLGWPLFKQTGSTVFLEYPLLLGAIAIFSTLVGALVVRVREGGDPTSAILRGIAVTAILAIAGFYYATWQLFNSLNLFYAAMIGVVLVVILAIFTNYYTSYKYSPTKAIAEASQAGPAINLIRGLANGLESAIFPIIAIALSVVGAYMLAGGMYGDVGMGMYGVAIAAMAMLSIAGIIVSVDAYGPIVDNAGGIAEMAELDPKVRDITDTLDAVGNTTKALTKVFAIGSAGLAALALLLAYMEEVATYRGVMLSELASRLALTRPDVILGLILGGGLTFVFAALCMKAVGRGAFGMVTEVRRQFKEIPGIMEGKSKPDYARCVDIATRTALRGMALPGAIVILSPIVVGFLFGPYALAGLLIGSIVSGLALALMMANGGAAWDNAKKYIETGTFGGKRSPAHAAAVVGDTVGDPCKDTAGPAINPMIKAINMISIILAGLIVATVFFA